MLINMFVQSSGDGPDHLGGRRARLRGADRLDTQRIKSGYFAVRGTAFLGKSAVMGALQLYLDFINMFLFLLRFMGNSRN